MKGVEFAVENGFSLIIALDCGIKANDKVEFANRNKVTDTLFKQLLLLMNEYRLVTILEKHSKSISLFIKI